MTAPDAVVSLDVLLAVDAGALDDDELKTLLGGFARVRACLDAAEAVAIAEFDQRGAFVTDGAVNVRSWLAHHTAIPRAAAGARVLLAKRLRRMPAMAAALAGGLVTDAHARALGRCLTPRTLEVFAADEALLVAHAEGLEADDFERVVTRWLQLNDLDGPDPGVQRPSQFRASRHFAGRTRLDGDLDLDHSTEFLAELEALHDELWRADQTADAADPHKNRSRAERNAAALVEMARRSSTTGDRDHDAADSPAGAHRPRRPLFVVVVDPAALAGDPTGSAELEDGAPVPRSLLERWACDTAIGRVIMAGGSVPIDLGRVTYTPSAAQRRALIARDRGCIVPGCNRKPRWCDAHHVTPWPHGPTNLDNLVLVCQRHHKQIHTRTITPQRQPATGHWTAARPDGTPLRQRPPPQRAA